MGKEKCAVVIATRNRLTLLRECIRCASCQTILPEQEYFIYHDDTEYLLRFLRMGIRTIVVKDTVLDHRTDPRKEKKHRRYTWKDYYAFRNGCLGCLRGTVMYQTDTDASFRYRL